METTEIVQAKEETNYYKNIDFEPMDHKTPGELSEIITLLMSEDVDWRDYIDLGWENSSTCLERMKKYNPKYLAADGMWPSSIFLYGQKNARYKKMMWLLTPDFPSKITKGEEVYLVAADFYLRDETFSNVQELGSDLTEEIRSEIRKSEDFKEGAQAFAPYLETVSMAGLGTASLIFAGILASDNENTNSESKINRRNFMKSSLAVVGTVAFLGGLTKFASSIYSPGEKAAAAKSQRRKEFFLKIADIAGSDIIKTDEVNARTAALYLKTEEAMARNHEEKSEQAAVLMGHSHSSEVNNIDDSRVYAQKMITRYIASIDRILKKLEKEYPKINRKKTLEAIGDIISATEVYKVKNPNMENDPEVALEASIKKVNTFKSQKIKNTIRDYIEKNF